MSRVADSGRCACKICGLTRPRTRRRPWPPARTTWASSSLVVRGGSPPQAAADVSAGRGRRAGLRRLRRAIGGRDPRGVSRAAGLAGRPAARRPTAPRTRRGFAPKGSRVWRVARLAGTGRSRASCASSRSRRTRSWSSPGLPHAAGGTGIALDLALARRGPDAGSPDATMVLAGGLTPETVAAAVALVRPTSWM